MKNRNQWRVKGAWILGMILMISCLSGCTKAVDTQEVPELFEPVGITMATTIVERGDILVMDELSVTVVPYTEKLFFEPINGENYGQIEKILAVPGQMVNEGDVLIQLNTDSLEKQITDLELAIGYMEYQFDCALTHASWEKEVATLEYTAAVEAEAAAQSAYLAAQNPAASEGEESSEEADGSAQEPVDTEALKEAWTAAQYDLQIKEVAVRQAEAAYSQLKTQQGLDRENSYAQLELLRDSREKMVLTAPFTGRIVEMYYSENDWIAAYDTAMIIADETQIIIQGEAFNNGAIINAKKVEALIDQVSYAVEYQEYDAEDYLKRKLNGEELPTRFLLSASENRTLNYGQSGMVRIITDFREGTLLLPIACLASDSVGSFVYMEQDGQRVKAYVSTGLKNATVVEILDGLQEGDKVYVGD